MPICNNGSVRRLRLEAGMTVDQLAWCAGMDQSTVCNAEAGRNVSNETVRKLCQALAEALGRDVKRYHIAL